MHHTIRRSYALLALLASGLLAACSDAKPGPVAAPTVVPAHHDVAPETNVIYNMDDIAADFPEGTFALDTDSSVDSRGTPSIAPDVIDGSTEFCRDAFKPVYLHWNGPDGIVSFLLNPPQLFVSYRAGTFKGRTGLIFRKAVYETVTPSQAEDAVGSVWRFQGRFNALCRGGEFELGPIVFNGQVIVTQDPITTPVLVSRGSGGGGAGTCDIDTYYSYETYDPYSPTMEDNSGCGTGDYGGETGVGGGSDGGANCHTEYIAVDMSTDGGLTWTTIWEGEALICE